MSRADDWFQQAKKDLIHAEASMELQHFEWACLAAQQAAEKAVKALFLELGADAWGHSILRLLKKLPSKHQPPEPIINAAKYLDKHYVTTRYPNALLAGSPEDFYIQKDAEESIEHARRIFEFCNREISTLRQKTS